MTAGDDAHRQALRRAAIAATKAPSIYNTQPWTIITTADTFEVRADWERALPAADPDRRQLHISCGCALFNAQASLIGDGWRAVPAIRPEPLLPDLLGTVTLSAEPVTDDAAGQRPVSPIGQLSPAIERRHTPRADFADESIDRGTLAELLAISGDHAAGFTAIDNPYLREQIHYLDVIAHDQDETSKAKQDELASWLIDGSARLDGVAGVSAPVPLRPAGGLAAADVAADRWVGLLALCTKDDNPSAWVAAGLTLEQALLRLALHGYAAVPLMQVIENPDTRSQLRRLAELPGYPHAVLRLGTAPSEPPTRRRLLADTIAQSG